MPSVVHGLPTLQRGCTGQELSRWLILVASHSPARLTRPLVVSLLARWSIDRRSRSLVHSHMARWGTPCWGNHPMAADVRSLPWHWPMVASCRYTLSMAWMAWHQPALLVPWTRPRTSLGTRRP